VTRTADPTRRAALLDRVVDYVRRHGVGSLSLRPLAKAVDSSPRVLLYYFGSKEELIVEALRSMRDRQKVEFARLNELGGATPTSACKAVWDVMSSPSGRRAFATFVDIYALALQDPAKLPGFLEDTVESWLSFGERERLADGYTLAQSRAIATVIIAGFRGFMLDLTATGDTRRVRAAVALWLDLLLHIPDPKDFTYARAR
jgi:AcrR family transcriptional regulator